MNGLILPVSTQIPSLINALSCAIVVLAPDNRTIAYVNETTETLLASKVKTLCGQPVASLLPVSFISLLNDHLKDDGLQPFTHRDVRVDCSPGKGFIADIRVTEWTPEAAQESLKQPHILLEIQPLDRLSIISRNTQLAYQQAAIKELSRNLAHEIKNPLGGIVGAAQLLARQLPDNAQELTGIITRESYRLQRLVDDMLGPNQPMQLGKMNIHQLLDQLSRLLAVEAPSINIIRDFDPSIPEIEADYDRLNVVFINLLNNARDAVLAQTEAPEIRLITRIERQFTLHQQRHRTVLRVSIADNGAGVPSELRPQIFLPTITSKPDGNGLGLAMAQTIVYQHGGLIDCEQSANDADETIFSVYLPLAQPVQTTHSSMSSR